MVFGQAIVWGIGSLLFVSTQEPYPVSLEGRHFPDVPLVLQRPGHDLMDVCQLLSRLTFVICIGWGLLDTWLRMGGRLRIEKPTKLACHESSPPSATRRRKVRRMVLFCARFCTPHRLHYTPKL